MSFYKKVLNRIDRIEKLYLFANYSSF